MLNRDRILELIPHQGASSLLDAVLSWSAERIACTASSHLDPHNPLRRAGELAALCGAEYGMQAAALHGALTEGKPQPAGFVAALRDLTLATSRLDDPDYGPLRIEAALELTGAAGTVYRFRVAAADGHELLRGQATIAFPAQDCAAAPGP